MQAFPFAILAMVFYVAGGVCQGLALTRRVPPHPVLVRALGVRQHITLHFTSDHIGGEG